LGRDTKVTRSANLQWATFDPNVAEVPNVVEVSNVVEVPNVAEVPNVVVTSNAVETSNAAGRTFRVTTARESVL
jgi:hypothetical protein